MEENTRAIDIMYYVSTPEFMERWAKAKEGELMCRMEQALGGSLPQFDSLETMLTEMDAADVERVFVTQTKMWSYRNHWMYMDTALEEVTQYTDAYPDRFSGLAGYNPYRITESLEEIDRAVRDHGFKGVYVHIYGFDIPLHDRRMYPLYAKCDELDVPVSLQVGHVLEGMPSEHGRPIYLDRVASDFPELKLIGSHTGWPWVQELISCCYKWEHVYIGIDAWLPKYIQPDLIQFMGSRLGQDRVLWGTNGLSWKEHRQQFDALELRPEARRKILRDNAIELFKL